jgi:two-component system response regulator RstA
MNRSQTRPEIGEGGFETGSWAFRCRHPLFPLVRGVRREPTAKGEEIDEVIGLELGADDYLAKPVRPRVLLARIKNLLRRSRPAEPEPSPPKVSGEERLELGKLVIDPAQRTVQVGAEPVDVTTAEFELLWFLAKRAGTVVTRETIYSELRGIEYDGIDRSIDLRVARLRRKLGDDARHPRLIKSVRGAGYLLVPDA